MRAWRLSDSWEMAVGAVIVLMAIWYLCMTWNERKQKLLMM